MQQSVVDFFQAFLEKQYNVTLDLADENLDSEGFKQKVAELDAYFIGDLKSGVVRSRQPGDDGFPLLKEELSIRSIRKLFIVRLYDNEKYGQLYQFIVGTDRKKGNKYFHLYYISNIAGNWKIISRYLINSGHSKWEWSGGAKIKDLGTFQEVNRFLEPNDENDLKDYKSDNSIIK